VEITISSLPHTSTCFYYQITSKYDKTNPLIEEAAERLPSRKIMTENPTVPSPPGLQQLVSNSTSAQIHETGDSNGVIQCICECPEDDGYTIQCDGCSSWQHIACMQVPSEELSSKYSCSICMPRPVDAKRAKELQRLRRREEKKRRRIANPSHKKKESQTSGPNGVLFSATPSASEKTGSAKLPSPREPQPSTSRKRANRTTSSTNGGAGSPTPFQDRNGDFEDDSDNDKYKSEFNLIEKNQYANDEVRNWLSLSEKTLGKRYSQQDLASIPKTSVQALPDSSKAYSQHSRWCFMLESACPRGKPVALFCGKVGFQDTYKHETINQYGLWHHPKPYVVFHPELPIYIDARNFGSEARFVRRSCQPNVSIGTIMSDDSSIHFGLFASQPIKPNTELTLEWDWKSCAALARHFSGAERNLETLTPEEIRQAASWAESLTDNMGDCACSEPLDCLLFQIRKLGGTAHKNGPNGTAKKHRLLRNRSSESSAYNESSSGNQLDDDEPRMKKARSRDLTPSSPNDTAVESNTMTRREAKKFQNVLSQIEKQDKELQQVIPQKRKKRGSMASIAPITSPGSEPSRGTDEPRKMKSRKTESVASSPGSNVREVSVVDASTGQSPTSSTRSRGLSSKSPAASSISSKVRRKVKKKEPKHVHFVDSAVQTDLVTDSETDSDAPWWKLSVPPTTPRPPRLPLRKRLMQSLLRDREEAASASPTSDKKRKHDSIAEDNSQSLPSPKMTKTSDVENLTTETPSESKQEKQHSTSSSPTLKPIKTDSSSASPQSPSGPALGDLFKDSERPSSDADRRKAKPPSPVDKPAVNGVQPPGLNLQVPASGSSVSATSPSQKTPQLSSISQTFSPSVLAAVQHIASSSPTTKTKKLSLQDYRKRKPQSGDLGKPGEKKEDSKPAEKKEDDMVKVKEDPSSKQQLSFLSVLGPSGESLPTPPPPSPPLP
jgi:hypothetical protein